jgi:hypothetical protein
MNNLYPPYRPTAPWQFPPHTQGGWPPGPYPGYPQPVAAYGAPVAYQQGIAVPLQTANSPSSLTNPRFIKGALVGAVVAYLLTNESVQQGAIKVAVKAWSLVQGGVEEMKERFRDAEAELHATQMQD